MRKRGIAIGHVKMVDNEREDQRRKHRSVMYLTWMDEGLGSELD